MSMLRFLIQRALYSIFVLLGLSIVIFIIARIMPGDPARMAVGARAPQWVVDRLREQMHLDKPIAVQYYYWLRDAVRGDFGLSLITQRPVTNDIKETLPASLELALYSSLIAGFFGIGMGIVSARYKDSWIDNLSRLFSYAGIVTPSYIFAILFILLFGFALKWFPIIGRVSENVPLPPKITGLVTIDALIQGQFSTFLDALWHIILPSFSLAMGSIAQAARITRSSMADNLTKDYIANVRALGVSERAIMSRFLLKPSLIPTISILGLDIAAILSVAFIVESIFNWPGMARYGMNAMLYKDLNAISAVILVFGAAFAIMNIIVDLIVAYLDPRIRLRAAKGE
ncbi:MAG: ABC transporter permease [Anaerolineales bacterium]|nr:ABC transporter permease [Anaerolineales bacterium]